MVTINEFIGQPTKWRHVAAPVPRHHEHSNSPSVRSHGPSLCARQSSRRGFGAVLIFRASGQGMESLAAVVSRSRKVSRQSRPHVVDRCLSGDGRLRRCSFASGPDLSRVASPHARRLRVRTVSRTRSETGRTGRTKRRLSASASGGGSPECWRSRALEAHVLGDRSESRRRTGGRRRDRTHAPNNSNPVATSAPERH